MKMVKMANMANIDISLSEIEIIPVKPQKGLLAFCSFVINNAISVNGIGIRAKLDGSGYLLTYPRKILPNSKEIGLFFPIGRQAAQAIEDRVIKAFLELQAKATANRRETNG